MQNENQVTQNDHKDVQRAKNHKRNKEMQTTIKLHTK